MDSARLVPLGRALAGHGLPRKSWDALVEARLIDAAEPIDENAEGGLDARQVSRLRALMDCRRSLGGRFRVSTLAFELARNGDRTIPVGLVKADLIARMARLFGLAKRSLEAYTGLTTRFGTAKSRDILAAADRVASMLSQHVPHESRAGARDAFRTVAFVMLNAIYLGADVRAQSHRVREALRDLADFEGSQGDAQDAPIRQLLRALSSLADRLSDIRDVASLDQRRNPIFRRIEAIPDAEFSKLFESWPEICGAVARAWTRLARSLPLFELSAAQRETFDTLLLAIVVLYCGASNEAETYAELLRASAAKVDESIDTVARWIEFGVAARRLLPERVPA
jgi:hypothetical protein